MTTETKTTDMIAYDYKSHVLNGSERWRRADASISIEDVRNLALKIKTWKPSVFSMQYTEGYRDALRDVERIVLIWEKMK